MKSTLFFRHILLHLILFSLLRLAFYFVLRPSDPISSDVFLKALWMGLRFDARLSCLLVLPMVLFAWKTWSPLASKFALYFWRIFYTLAALIWSVFYVIDFGFYGYLNSRMNSSIMIYFENPEISLGMLWQSYPVVWILVGYFILLGIYFHLLRRFVFFPIKTSFLRLPKMVLHFAFVGFFLIGLYGNLSQYPLRWSEAFFSSQHFVSHLALNPIIYFFESYEFSAKKSYDVDKTRASYPVMADFLGVENKDVKNLNFLRQVAGSPDHRSFNVVVLVMESMAFSKTNLSGNTLSPTPYLESLAKESYWFSHYFSPCEGTARNMFSIMTAIPDVTKIETSTRNPLVVDQRLIGNGFKNHRKMYFLGGSASWANVRGIFSHNLDDVEIYEEGSFSKSNTDVWGISDLDLFIEAHHKLESLAEDKSTADQPFFAVIQSASFHRPYTIPKNALEFKNKEVVATTLKEAGFYSQEQYNSLRFSDYSLGHFFELAKKSKYYKNTLFIVTGDHGLPDEGGVNVPEGMHAWMLEKYHVPLILHNKQIFAEPREDKRIAGHADIMTTAAYLAGVDHVNTTFGRNLFDGRFDKERYAFIYNYYSELGEYGLLGDDYYYHYDDKNKSQLFLYNSSSPTEDVREKFPEVFNRMKALGDGYIETARYMLFNNQKERK